MTGHGDDAARLEELAARLDAIVDELDDVAFERLRVAAADGDTARPVGDRELVRARRAVEKAAHLVRRAGPSGAGPSGAGPSGAGPSGVSPR